MSTDAVEVIQRFLRNVRETGYPLAPDRDRIRKIVDEAGGPQHFLSTNGGALLVYVTPGAWFKGLQAHVLLFAFDTDEQGRALWAEFQAWRGAKPGIRAVSVAVRQSPRAERILREAGFVDETFIVQFRS